jgi:type II secretory pathway pseudopilin PulG
VSLCLGGKKRSEFLCLGAFVAKKMKAKSKQSGLTLTEMTVVVASIAILVAIGLPAVRAFFRSFETEAGTKNTISAALSSARAMATEKHRYAGIRFQKAYNRNAADPLDPLTAPQYMIFIVHDPASEPNGTGLANGFRAIEGLKPVKLPDSVGVMDLVVVQRIIRGTQIEFTEYPINVDTDIDSLEELRDTTTFSIVFSPSGKLVIHEVRVRNRNGKKDNSSPQSMDDIFNTLTKITDTVNPAGMLIQDDDISLGLGPEYSRNSFIIYDRPQFNKTDINRRWRDYLGKLERIYINPYTGTIIHN